MLKQVAGLLGERDGKMQAWEYERMDVALQWGIHFHSVSSQVMANKSSLNAFWHSVILYFNAK